MEIVENNVGIKILPRCSRSKKIQGVPDLVQSEPFSTGPGWLRLQFDQSTTVFDDFRMASTTVLTSGLQSTISKISALRAAII